MDIEKAFFNTSDFQLQKQKLGEGTFGTVYLAQNINDGKLYACKIIKTHANFNGQDQMMLMRESLILNKLKHPGIIEFKGVNFQSFTDPNKLEPSIITEFLKGGSLKTVLDQEKKSLSDSKLSPTKKYILLLGITNAMQYLHKHGIIHRDLKPENILTDEERHPHICDFGLSRCFKKSLTNSEKLTMTGQIGTPIYMAPEIFNGDDHYSSSVDVYSFAMIAYELVTGKVPFSELGDKITPVALGIKVINGYRPKFPKYVPKKMQDLISRCWSKKPSKRPSFEEVFNELSKDFTYLGEPVDDEEINNFLSFLGKLKVEKSDDLYKENNELRSELNEIKKKLSGYTDYQDFFIMGLLKFHGHKNERNEMNGMNYLTNSSEKGNSYSSLLLGLMYETGEVVKSDFNKAKFYFERSASQGNSLGYHLIGWCYDNGYGVERNYTKAIEYYQKSADFGNSTAFFNIGCLYENGEGVNQDYSKALEYYQKSADLGNSCAFYNIGCLYENGQGVDKNYSKALEYYRKSADLRNEDAPKYLKNLQKLMKK